MNKSHFSQLLEKHHLDAMDIWQDVIYTAKPYSKERALSDQVETEFWQKHSEVYDSIPSLYDYAPHVFEKLSKLIGDDKRVLEIGCGTGKFTIPISKQSQHLYAVDFSQNMIDKAKQKTTGSNISFVQGKFEDLNLPSVDVIFAVNSIYRMLDLKKNLEKMLKLADEKVIIVWTMQRSIYDRLLNKSPIKGIGRRQEYIHLLAVLYEMGIDPNLMIVPSTKRVPIDDVQEHYDEIIKLCNEYQLDSKNILEDFKTKLIEKNHQLFYDVDLCVAFIVFSNNPDFSLEPW